MTTSLAPRSLRAVATWVITLTWVETGLPPQTTIRSDLAISRASTPRLAPTPASQPASVSATADRRMLARIAHRVAQPVDAVALHQPHRPGVVIAATRPPSRGAGPPGSAARQPRRAHRPRRPATKASLPAALLADPPQRHGKAARDGAGARHSGRPWRTRRPACRTAPRPRAPGRSAGRRRARPPARRRSGSHAGRRCRRCRAAFNCLGPGRILAA